ncbi:MAG: alpha-hydroxy acid oxidase [Pseudomonadota bacterium]|nr:alpha-hydroxy acid oxidase [Pseudomonadota bacterium]
MTDVLPPLAQIPPHVVAVADYEPLARERMTAAAWAWLQGGAADELTLHDNQAAFARLRLLPRVLRPMHAAHTSLTLLGQPLAHPVLLAPVAYQLLVHPQGEAATALAAAAIQAGMVVSTQASTSLQVLTQQMQQTGATQVAPLWFQLYMQPTREATHALVQRAEAAGCRALVLSVDAPVSGPRNRQQRAGFALPPGVSAVNLHGLPEQPMPVAQPGQSLLQHPAVRSAPTWDDVRWLRGITALPIVLKGILAADDAVRAADEGMNAVIVSNHGGRTLDTAIATLDALPAVARAAGQRLPVLMDGGIRRGTDIFKALALGARAVLVGRPFMHGLAAAGAPGVAHVLHLLRTELEVAMALTGCPTLADIDASRLALPQEGGTCHELS